MVKKRTVVIISLFTTIVFASVILRTDIFSTVHAPTMTQTEFNPLPTEEVVVTPAPTTVYEEETVTVAPVAPSAPAKRCYVSGCSGQLCSSTEGMMSTCEYKEEYACYQTATCEVQATGECGWTETDKLNSCQANAGMATQAGVELSI